MKRRGTAAIPAMERFKQKYDINPEDWKLVFKDTKFISTNTRLRSKYVQGNHFNFYSQKRMHLMGLASSPKCPRCDCKIQDTEHLFVSCVETQEFWYRIQTTFSNEFCSGISEFEKLIGCIDTHPKKRVSKQIILFFARKYLYDQNRDGLPLNIDHVISIIEEQYEKEQNKIYFKSDLNELKRKYDFLEQTK